MPRKRCHWHTNPVNRVCHGPGMRARGLNKPWINRCPGQPSAQSGGQILYLDDGKRKERGSRREKQPESGHGVDDWAGHETIAGLRWRRKPAVLYELSRLGLHGGFVIIYLGCVSLIDARRWHFCRVLAGQPGRDWTWLRCGQHKVAGETRSADDHWNARVSRTRQETRCKGNSALNGWLNGEKMGLGAADLGLTTKLTRRRVKKGYPIVFRNSGI